MKTDTTFADATLVCDGVTIPCHRVILAARSEHFKNLFTKEGFVEGDNQKHKKYFVPFENKNYLIIAYYNINWEHSYSLMNNALSVLAI